MKLSVAIAGKGGTGKTTLSALLVRCLQEAGVCPILAVDADPNSNLAEALGSRAPAPKVRRPAEWGACGPSRTRFSGRSPRPTGLT